MVSDRETTLNEIPTCTPSNIPTCIARSNKKRCTRKTDLIARKTVQTVKTANPARAGSSNRLFYTKVDRFIRLTKRSCSKFLVYAFYAALAKCSMEK